MLSCWTCLGYSLFHFIMNKLLPLKTYLKSPVPNSPAGDDIDDIDDNDDDGGGGGNGANTAKSEARVLFKDVARVVAFRILVDRKSSMPCFNPTFFCVPFASSFFLRDLAVEGKLVSFAIGSCNCDCNWNWNCYWNHNHTRRYRVTQRF